MPIQVVCPNPECKKPIALADDAVSRVSRCPHCGKAMRLSTSSQKRDRRSSTGDASGSSSPRPATGPSADLPRTIGPFEIRRKLGEGGFGVVYQGYEPRVERDVAIKLLQVGHLDRKECVERFEREAKALAKLHHSNIAPLYQFGEHERGCYFASKFIEGQDLSDLIPKGGLECMRAVRLEIQLLEALAHAHDHGVCHRDVKPSNARVDGGDHLFLIDFGLVKDLEQSDKRMTQEGQVLGTLPYMSPEQISGDVEGVGPATDQFSAGVVLYELLTGELPFGGMPFAPLMYHIVTLPPPPPSTLRPDLDPQLEAICLRAMAKRPPERFASCREMAELLRAWLVERGCLTATQSAPSKGVSRPADIPGQRTTVKPSSIPTIIVAPSVAPPGVQPPPLPRPGRSYRRLLVVLPVVVALAIIVAGGYYAVQMMSKPRSQSTSPRIKFDFPTNPKK